MPLVNNFWGAIFLPNHLPFVLCSRRMFKRLSASFHSAEILSVTAPGSKIWCPPRGPKLSWLLLLGPKYVLPLLSKLSITNYGNYQFSSTPPFLSQKTYMELTFMGHRNLFSSKLDAG